MVFNAKKYRGAARRALASSRSKAARTAKTARSRNKPVARIYRKAATAPRTRVAVNRSAITTLARQVRTLQNQQIGQLQRNFETAAITGGDYGWNIDNPMCFAANNFLKSAPIYIGHWDTTTYPGKSVPGHVVRTNWAHANPTGFVTGKEFDYWAHCNDDEASHSSYKALSTTINFNLEAIAIPANKTYWVRIDLLKMKKVMLHSNVRKLSLPTNMQALGHLCDDNMMKRNKINPEYFRCIQTKWIKLTHEAATNKTLEKWVQMHIPFKSSRATQKLDLRADVTTSTGLVQETFLSNMPQDDIYWVVMSNNVTNDNQSTVELKVEMTRTTRYRDALGVAA